MVGFKFRAMWTEDLLEHDAPKQIWSILEKVKYADPKFVWDNDNRCDST